MPTPGEHETIQAQILEYAVDGSVVRDMLVRELPAILYYGFYAAAIVRALVSLGLHALGLPEPVQLGAAAVACSALRFCTLVKNANLPTAPRLPESPGEMKHRKAGRTRKLHKA